MDFSAFNLLMNIVPNAASGETRDTAAANSAAKAQESIRTGEAFLTALKEVRGGKTEKTAETIFSSMAAKADASSSLKNLRGQNAGDKNVKVIKLHLKRTRASETMQKADAARARAKPGADDRQKIPTQENNAGLNETAVVPVTENAVQAAPDEMQDISFNTDAPVFDEAGKTAALPAEETTAADILINAFLQPAQTPQAPVQQAAADENSTEISVQPQNVEAAPQTVQAPETASEKTPDAAPLMPQTETAQAAPEARTQVQAATQIQMPQEKNAALKQDSAPEQTVKTDDSRLPRQADASDIVTNKAEAPVEKAAVKTHAAPAAINKAPEAKAAQAPAAENAPDVFAKKSYSAENNSETRRQAADLAARLPQDTKVSVAVRQDVQTAAASSFHGETKAKTDPAKEHKTALTAQEEQPVPEPETETAAVKPVKAHEQAENQNSQARPRAESHQQALNNNTQAAVNSAAAAAPKSTASATAPASFQNAVEGVSASSSANGSSVPAGQVLFNAPNETLKGKAVAGTPVPAKSVPANELVDQIKVNITKAVKAGLDKIDIILKPKELGTVRVRLEIDKDGGMKATLSASRADTLDMLQKDISALKQALSDSGFNMNDNTFSFNYRGEQFDGNGHQAAQEQRQNPEQAAAAAPEDENDLETAEIAALSSGISGRYALNIRV